MTSHLLGTVARLQVQRAPLKPGVAPYRVYDPSPLVPVSAVRVDPRGVHGLLDDGTEVLDVHHMDHPLTRDAKGRAGLTVMTRSDYVRLRSRFGSHVVDGCAGEVVLINGARPVHGEDLYVETVRAGVVRLTDVRVAKPCVEFCRFCLRLPSSALVDELLEDAMSFLDEGGRGYRARAAGGPVDITLGARMWVGDLTRPQQRVIGDVGTAGRPGKAVARR